jgi:hypothetical protein
MRAPRKEEVMLALSPPRQKRPRFHLQLGYNYKYYKGGLEIGHLFQPDAAARVKIPLRASSVARTHPIDRS